MSQHIAPPEGFVEVEVAATGRRQWVPPHFIDHPRLGAGLIPITADSPTQSAEDTPTASWNNDRIKAWAADHEIDLGEASTKAEMLAVIAAAPASDPQ